MAGGMTEQSAMSLRKTSYISGRNVKSSAYLPSREIKQEHADESEKRSFFRMSSQRNCLIDRSRGSGGRTEKMFRLPFIMLSSFECP